MIARRRAAFLKLTGLLRAVEANPADIGAVRRLNLGLLKEIVRDEGHVQRLRGEVKALTRDLKTARLSKPAAAALRRRIGRRKRALERYLDQLYIWKCLGDGLAHAYIDSWSLKHCYFDTRSTGVRPDAGFISGKAGLKVEVDVLNRVLDFDVPAVLCDVTHTLRHGDICILIGEDPSFIEVKSRSGLNERGRRQLERLEQLGRFLTNDGEPGFRGLPHVQRQAAGSQIRDCTDDLNLCIENAWRDGYNAVSPERGLVYLASYGDEPPIDELLPHLGMAVPLAFYFNGDKLARTWAPFRPFVNTLRSVQRLYDFVVGDLKIFVFIDGGHLCRELATPGFRASLVEDSAMALVVEHQTLGGYLGISHQFVSRLGFECLSPAWFVQEHRATIAAIYTGGGEKAGPRMAPQAYDDAVAVVATLPRSYTVDGPPPAGVAERPATTFSSIGPSPDPPAS